MAKSVLDNKNPTNGVKWGQKFGKQQYRRRGISINGAQYEADNRVEYK